MQSIEGRGRLFGSANCFDVDGDAAFADQISELWTKYDEILPKPVGV